MASRYARLSREQLAVLVPELLLTGHLIDRAGMAYALAEWGPEGMTQIAVEEWMAASPVYTRRMQRAFGFEGDDVVTIFKGMQLEIGAPPQFMDFRYWIDPDDPRHGGFHLDHCGALLDVEPMGAEMVTHMCHHIEDPTFDATAVATNPRARMRPLHRPPRTPADRRPHCAWTVDIDPDATPREATPALALIAATRVATIELDPIDGGGPGRTDYSGPLVSDIAFGDFAHSALVRLADEVVVQQHILNLSFVRAVRDRAADEEQFARVARGQLVGSAGVTAARLAKALGLSPTTEHAAQLIELHPLVNPAGYVHAERAGSSVEVTVSPAHEDGAWISLIDPAHPEPLQAIVRALSPYLAVEITGGPSTWTARVVETETAAPETEAVQLAKLSRGATFEFGRRESLPLYVV